MDLRAAFARKRAARLLCNAITSGNQAADVLIATTKDPEVFTEVFMWQGTGRSDGLTSCPLCLAAERVPAMALAMLAAGADPRRVQAGVLRAAVVDCFKPERSDTLEVSLELFSALLAAGVDPGPPVEKRFCDMEFFAPHSLLAYLIRRGAGSFIDRLFESPRFDGLVWSDNGKAREAATYARQNMARAGLIERLEGWSRWGGPRRAWVSAVLRAPPILK